MIVAKFNLLIRVSKICTQETILIATNLHSKNWKNLKVRRAMVWLEWMHDRARGKMW